MQVNETVRASSGFHHTTRALAPGELLPKMPSLFDQVMACRNGMSASYAANDEDMDEIGGEMPDDELDD